LTKILFVAIASLFVENMNEILAAQLSQQTVFNLPVTEIYGLGEQIKGEGMLKCFLKNGLIIEFPVDGTQPMTKDAIKYSCANIKDDEITEWYMQMFGVLPFRNKDNPNENDYIKAGYNNNISQRIINFESINWNCEKSQEKVAIDFDKTILQDPLKLREISKELLKTVKERNSKFKTIFRQIASNPIGRLLLYRILIEIRRLQLPDEMGTTEDFNQMPYKKDFRNNARSLTVSYGFLEGFNGNSYVQEWRYFPAALTESSKISITFDPVPIFIIHGKEMIRRDTTSNEIAALMFHEMLHWYQDLRAYQRTQKERILISETSISGQVSIQSCVQEWYNTIEYWIDYNYFRGDELRVICGGMNENARNALYGDNLSENAFRYFSNLPLRFGHSFRCKQCKLCREILFSIFLAATNVFP